MRFLLIDRIVQICPGRRIVAHKALGLTEEYLADHFPSFPVMPGVLMVEAMVQSAAWLVRATNDFSTSMVVLHRAHNVVYRSFVLPGEVLRLEVQARTIGPDRSEFVGVGRAGQRETVKARFSLRQFNLADESASLAAVDRELISQARRQFELLGGATLMRSVMAPQR